MILGDGGTEVGIDFLDDIHQRRRHLNAVGHREAESHSLTGLMVGVLPQDDHLHLVEGSMVEGSEDIAPFGVAGILTPLGHKELFQLGEIWCLELRLQHGEPRGVYFYCHVLSY